MHLLGPLILALGTANTAYAAAAAANSVFYAAFSGQNPNDKSTGCTGQNLGSVNRGSSGSSACKDVGEGACVTLTGKTGDATKCKVLTYPEVGCAGDEESTILGKKGDYANENFASFKAMCS